ncbi:MAG: DUF3429 domain-containing protein [Pseudomonadota bacterium]
MSEILSPIPPVARILGLGGLIPFVALSVAVVAGVTIPVIGNAPQALANYAAVIVSFIGAVHWGVAVGTNNAREQHFIYSVIPALLAWVLLFFPIKISLFGMAVVVVGAYLADRTLIFAVTRPGYATLRLQLTVVVSLSLLCAALAL